MNNLKLLKFEELIDLLAEHTSQYTKMVKSKTFEEEFVNCKQKLKAIQTEIKCRQGENKEVSDRSSSLPGVEN